MSDIFESVPNIEVFSTENYIIFIRNEHSLWVDKRTGNFCNKPACNLASTEVPQCLGTCLGIIGKLQLPGVTDQKILVIKQCSDSGHDIYKIRTIGIIHVSSNDAHTALNACKKHGSLQAVANSSQKSTFAKTLGVVKSASSSIKSSTQQAAAKIISRDNKLEKRMLDELCKIFNDTDSFYFSVKHDLTNSIQRQCKLDEKVPQWKNVDERFFWNKHMVQDIISLDSPSCDPWIIPIIQGFVQTEKCKIESCFDVPMGDFIVPNFDEVEVSLISRRSRHRAGTRYKRRGVDEEGHCANYVETEQILRFKHHVTSFVQTRGSVPVFWAQPGYKYRPPPTLLKGPTETQTAFNKHFEQEEHTYGPICIVNLVEQSGKEKVIWDAYTNHTLAFNNPGLTYCTFDFHEYCRGMHFENVSYLVSSLAETLRSMGYCWSDKQGVICEQTGVFRVNCIDCLDRTNVVQTAFGKAVLEMQMTKLGLLLPEGHLPHDMRATFQQLWANSGDVISRQYAGTNALKGDYTRTGERKLTGLMKDGMNSANRYCRVHFRDCYRQAALDLMQGSNPEPIDLLNELAASTSEVATVAGAIIPDNAPPASAVFNGALAPELRFGHVLYLSARYYLSRFKDASRQATIDIMLGHEVSEDVFSEGKGPDEEDAAATAEHVKLLLDDCKKLLINDPAEVLGCWGLIDADPVTGDPSETEMDSILILTKYAYYVAEYDEQVDRVSKYQRVSLRDIRSIEVGMSGVSAPLSVFKKANAPHCLRIHYLIDNEHGYFHTFRATGLRFFNNVAVQISTPDEMLESLKAICETFLVALEVADLPPVPVTHEKALERLKSKILSSENTCRLGSYLDLGSSQGISRNVSETQLNNLKNAGTKALSNISQQFSKMGKLGQSFRKPPAKQRQDPNQAKPPVFSIEPAADASVMSPSGSESSNSSDIMSVSSHMRSRHWHLPSTGILMTDIPAKDLNAAARPIADRAKSPLLHAKTQGAFDPSVLGASLKKAQLKAGEEDDSRMKDTVKTGGVEVPQLLNVTPNKRCSSEKNLTLSLAASQSETALKSIRSNIANAITSPASATRDMLSPLSKIAKGVHSFGATLDPRRLRVEHNYRASDAHLEDVKRLEDRWSGCSTKLIAL